MKSEYTDKECKAIEDGGFIDQDGKWNSIVVDPISGELCRKRVETLVIKDKTKIYLWLQSSGRYKIPGGSTERDIDDMTQACHECREEARLDVKNIVDTGIEYTEITNFPDWAKTKHIGLKWNGKISRVYVAEFNKKYRGNIDELDRDELLKYGQFYDINDVFEILRPEHQKALIDVLHIQPVCENIDTMKCKLFN